MLRCGFRQPHRNILFLSSESGRNSLARDPEHAKKWLVKHQDRLLFGRDLYGGKLQEFLATIEKDLPQEGSSGTGWADRAGTKTSYYGLEVLAYDTLLHWPLHLYPGTCSELVSSLIPIYPFATAGAHKGTCYGKENNDRSINIYLSYNCVADSYVLGGAKT
jgi:hypothetical protein